MTMGLYEKMEADMKAAMKAGEAVKLSVLRMAIAAARKAQIDKKSESITDPDMLQVLQRHVKQHKESIEQFRSGNRQDLVDKEAAELKVLEAYMPEPMGEEELKAVVGAAIKECGAQTKTDMGKVMKLVMEKAKGRCDGKLISRLVTEALK